MVLPYIGLCINPLISACGAIAMRKMKKMHESVVATYVALSLLAISGLFVTFSKYEDGQAYEGFSFFNDLNMLSWFIIPINSIVDVAGTTTRFAAFRAYEPAKLQIYSFIPRIQQVFIDALFFGILFTSF